MSGTAGPIPSGSGATELDRIRALVASQFPVYETRIGPQSVLLAVHLDPATLEGRFDRLRQDLWEQGYIPLLRREGGEDFVEVLRRPRARRSREWVNVALLLATVATTVFAGAMIWLTYVGGVSLTVTDFVDGGLFFAGPLLAILGVHEFAHYWMARRRRLDASLPYFIPIPPPFLFGTFGAFVSIREPFPDRKALFDVGVAGPIAGFALSVPIALAGLVLSAHSPVLPASYCGPSFLGQSYGNILLGPSLFWWVLSQFLPPGLLNLHPLALAGWVGIFITAINLLPAGSLDGGHVFRALLGDRARFVSYAAAILLFGFGFFYYGWLLFAILVLLLGLRHPPPLNDRTPLDAKRYVVGALVAVVLVSGFVIVPLSTPPGTVSFSNAEVQIPGVTPPGAAIAANLSAEVTNGDPVPHGYAFTATVTTVVVANGTSNRTLNASELAAWATTLEWRYVLPNGTTVELTGPTATLPGVDEVTINATSTISLGIDFWNSAAAVVVDVALGTTQSCAESGTGTAGTLFSATFP